MGRERLRTLEGARGACLSETDGAASVEALIIVPVMTVFLVGVLEFGVLLHTKLQVEAGVHDASRYLARCNLSGSTCQDVARNLAVYGTVDSENAVPRTSDWSGEKVQIEPVSGTTSAGIDYTVWRVSTAFDYHGSPMVRLIGVDRMPLWAKHEERSIGQ